MELLIKRFRLKPAQVQGLTKLGLATTEDLLYYFPQRYEAPAPVKLIKELEAGQTATVFGQVRQTKISRAWRKKIPLAEVTIEDATGRIKAIWFHQAYLARKIYEGDWLKLSGRVAKRGEQLYLANPTFTFTPEATLFTGETNDANALTPIYPETRGLSSAWFQYTVKQLLTDGRHKLLTDPLPPEILARYHLPGLETSLLLIHQPRDEKEALAARKRFALEEIFYIQLARLAAKNEYGSHEAWRINSDQKIIDGEFTKRLSFTLTKAQQRAITQILADLNRTQPMLRLLEGDVGSGKTSVAAAAAFAAVRAGFEVVLMAPTEILARQHFESFIASFSFGKVGGKQINLGLITGSECLKFPSKIFQSATPLGTSTHISRAQFLKWVANGEIPVVIGTHAVIQKTVVFKNLALAIIDEQHRFGVKQRAALIKKTTTGQTQRAPHLLSLSATPIPRTLALTFYGDLDLTLLDELPPGRQPIITEIVAEETRTTAYVKIRQELQQGRQCYVICPRIDVPDPSKELALYAKSAKQEAQRLQEKVFPDFKIGLIHSKLKPKDKEGVMGDFTRGDIHILVATSVVEVGVNVPNATVIIIEGAEHFGLAQLHQLRGRVWRSAHQSYCFLFADKLTGQTLKRLQAVKNAANGFELAEIDLRIRGAGSLAGGKQWGLSDLGMEALKNLKMVEAARTEAHNLLRTDPTLAKYPLIRARLATDDQQPIHFE